MNRKIFKVLALLISVLCIFSTCSFATGAYIPGDITPNIDNENVKGVVASLIGSLKWFGYVLAIGMVIFIGIKYVMASADERASMKGMLVKVVIGSFIIVTSVTIVDAVMSIVQGS